ncbi:MAG: DUF885 domain-containing protein [Acidobacteria bacterium]|nr:MAG: DUF885 domain-containing protein [Acidobacteriota bacterium]
MRKLIAVLLMSASVCAGQMKKDSLAQLATDFWIWRAEYRPFTADDIPRMEHKSGVRDWSTASMAEQRADLAEFERRWEAMRSDSRTVPQNVDYRLMGSAIARVSWEFDINPRWQRDPTFYVEQTVVALQDALLPPPPLETARAEQVVTRAENIPSILEQARSNLKPLSPFAQLAITSLSDISQRLAQVEKGVSPLLSNDGQRARFHAAIGKASTSLVEYREWLKQSLPAMPKEFALGAKSYEFFLHRVALLPYTPAQLLEMARQDFDRVLSMEAYERQRDLHAPQLAIASSSGEELARMERDEESIRQYLTQHEILSVPPDIPHWTLRLEPDYLAALDGFGELDDFAGPARLHQDGVRWIASPSDRLPYFQKAYAEDTRTTGVDEGVPGHFLQLSLAWRHADPVRRQYYDSSANEGIGFYAEEMMLQAGLYDDRPRSRQIIYNFARLRALRVEADVKLALGEFSIEQAADYLMRTVPMDRETANSEAASFATAPGLAIAYEIGKVQIEHMLAERRLQQGDKFSLRDFHDYVWVNGNVPFALQRWELLGLDDDMRKVDELTR